ncbi:hypothetical protein CHUAL_007131 [Chamberlinius hualienensis]
MESWKAMRFIAVAICLSQIVHLGAGQLEDENTEIEQSEATIPCTTSDGEPGFCSPLISCQFESAVIDFFSNNSCNLGASDPSGVCCSNITKDDFVPLGITRVAAQAATVAGFASPALLSPPSPISQQDIQESENKAIEVIKERTLLENEIVKNEIVDKGITNRSDTAEDLHSFINFALPEALEADRIGSINEQTSTVLRAQFDFPLAGSVAFSQGVSSVCRLPLIACPATKYRTIDGSCNNLDRKDWGKSFTAFSRMSFGTTAYADGISAPRIAISGKPLPSCRLVTTEILQSRSKAHPHLDILFMAFGQFVDHDLSQTPTKKVNVSGIFRNPPCCGKEERHPECFPIEISKSDSFYKKFNIECMELVRSIASGECNLGQREQQNQLTSFLDASQIYGVLDRLSENLRSHKDGKLRADLLDREFPPHKNSGPCNGNLGRGLLCVETGDTRATEQPLLTIFHIIFLREHNRIASGLAHLHPEWDDETLFQESRRIVIAIYQNIIYNEFLPVLLGWQKMHEYGLVLSRSGFSDPYDSFTNPSVINEFATAAFRFGHSMVQATIQLVSDKGLVQNQRLLDNFLTPFNASLLDSYIRGALVQRSEGMDRNVITELTNRLFQRNGNFGQDLAAINCQRGRDHGLLSYTGMRGHCQLEAVFSFKDLEKHMDPDIVKSFQSIYE